MIRFNKFKNLVVCLVLAASVTVAQADGLKEILSGKTLTSGKGKNTIFINPNGKLSGNLGKDKFVGTWEIRDGLWCRTLVQPKRVAGNDCQTVKIKGNQATFIGAKGSSTHTIN